MKQYRYTLYGQDMSKTELGVMPKMDWRKMAEVLGCQYIEIIPKDYYNPFMNKQATAYGDEEGRFNVDNHPNLFFKDFDNGFNVVGNVLMEETVK